jgi:hypothetical protein
MLFMDLIIMLCCRVRGCEDGGCMTDLFSDGTRSGTIICVGSAGGGTTGAAAVTDDCLGGVCPEGGTIGMVETIVGFPTYGCDDILVDAV